MEGLAVQFAGAFVEQIGGEMRCPGLVGVILAGSAVESVVGRVISSTDFSRTSQASDS